MDEENRTLRHKLKNVEQEKLALAKLAERAADQIDELVGQNCSGPAVEKAKAHADRLRKAVEQSRSSD